MYILTTKVAIHEEYCCVMFPLFFQFSKITVGNTHVICGY